MDKHTFSNLFNTKNNEEHKRSRKPVTILYSINAIKKYKPFINTIIRTLLLRLNKKAQQNKRVDLSTLISYNSNTFTNNVNI